MFKFTEVDVAYHKNIVLQQLNLTFTPTGITTLIGPNGSGKSTLLKCLANLLPIHSGTLTLNNEPIYTISPSDYAKRVSYLPQSRDTVDIPVHTLVAHGRFPHVGFSTTLTLRDRQLIQEAMAFTKVGHLANKSLMQLSGGEAQKVYLAMTLAQDTPILLLDEPTTFLDLNHQLDFLDLIKTLSKTKKIILILHDLNQAFTYSDEIILLHQGRLVAQDTPSNLVNSNHINSVFSLTCTTFMHDGKPYYLFDRKSEQRRHGQH